MAVYETFRLEASQFFHPDERKGTYLLVKKAFSTSPPTLNQMIRLIASLGSFLGCKGDDKPSAKPSGPVFNEPSMPAEQFRPFEWKMHDLYVTRWAYWEIDITGRSVKTLSKRVCQRWRPIGLGGESQFRPTTWSIRRSGDSRPSGHADP